ncbi:hypothetical protein HLPR_15140 [Helicovermis profundi]|uniref:NADP-dependent oxidoreductase domain-containing protein n=2 Tax=Helicovermis profundi TaxID=3065157 RepID=A0AAU9E454_9FIRM|nr:hypothetical protein HLPR_15140 [Clostridia bacterium S502]
MNTKYLGENIKKFGFGFMRLAMVGDNVELEHTKIIADKFIENGFTYFDTTYFYIIDKYEEAFKEVLKQENHIN